MQLAIAICVVINKEEFEQTRTFVLSKYRDIANIYDMELSEYVEKILNMNESDFENFCDDEAVTQIQMKLVIEEIAQRENIVISQNELEPVHTNIASISIEK